MRRNSLAILSALSLIGLTITACGTLPPASPTPAATAAEPAKAPEPPPKPVTAAAAANMANNCFACHGPNGVSPATIPSLHLMTEKNISEMLRAFKTGQRPSTVMGRHAKAYSDAEIDALASHIASLNKR